MNGAHSVFNLVVIKAPDYQLRVSIGGASQLPAFILYRASMAGSPPPDTLVTENSEYGNCGLIIESGAKRKAWRLFFKILDNKKTSHYRSRWSFHSLRVEVFFNKQRLPLTAFDKLRYQGRGQTIKTFITVTPIAPFPDISTCYLAVKGLFKKALSN